MLTILSAICRRQKDWDAAGAGLQDSADDRRNRLLRLCRHPRRRRTGLQKAGPRRWPAPRRRWRRSRTCSRLPVTFRGGRDRLRGKEILSGFSLMRQRCLSSGSSVLGRRAGHATHASRPDDYLRACRSPDRRPYKISRDKNPPQGRETPDAPRALWTHLAERTAHRVALGWTPSSSHALLLPGWWVVAFLDCV